jgi:hypothetical protein
MDFFKGIGDFFGGLFGRKKKQNEENNTQINWQPQSSQSNFQPNALSSQADLNSTKFNPNRNLDIKPDYSFKTTALTPSTKPVDDTTDFSKDNTSGLNLNFNGKNKTDGNRFTLGGRSKVENTAVHEDDLNNTIKQLSDRYHNEHDSIGRFWGSFAGDTDRRDKELRRKILTDEMKKITDGLGSNPDGSYKRDYNDDEAYKMATLQLAMRHGIDRQPLKAFVPAGSIDKKPINSNTMGEWGLAAAKTIKNMTDGEDGIGGLIGNALLGKRKTDEGFNLGRFIADLPAGMIAGGAGIGSGISDALSGKRMQDDGAIQDLNGLQRLGSGADAAISAFGLPSGASGKLLNSLFKRGAKQAVSEAGKAGFKEAAKRIAKDLAKGAASEGLEEGVQQIAQNLSDTDNYDKNGNFKTKNLFNQVPESAALGALGGGIMGGASFGIDAGKTKLGELHNNIRQNIDQRINPQTNPVQNAVAKIEANKHITEKLRDAYVDGKLPIPQTTLTPNAGNRKNLTNLIETSLIDGSLPESNYIGRMSRDSFLSHNKIQDNFHRPTIESRDIYANGNNFVEHAQKRFSDNPTSETIRKLADSTHNALFGKNNEVLLDPNNPYNTLFINQNNPTGVVPVGKNLNTGKTEMRGMIPAREKYIENLKSKISRISPEMEMSGINPDSGLSLSQNPNDVNMKLDENSTKNGNTQNVNRTDTEQTEMSRQNSSGTDIENYIKDQVKNQKKSMSGGLIQKIRDVKGQLRHHLIDDSTAYEQYIPKGNDKWSKLAREQLKEDIRNDIDKVRSSDMIAQQFIRDNGLAELGKMSTKDLHQFQQYLIARRHAADLHKQGINTGRDLDMDLAIIDKYKKKFTEQEKIYRNFNKQLLNYMEDNGLISKELHNKLNQNTAYTPYQRLMDDVSSFTGHSQQLGNLSSEQVIKKMKGSDRTILNPIEATMSNTMRIINEGQRNIAARKIAENAFSEHRLRDGEKPRAGFDTLNFMENGKKVSYEVPKMVASEMKRLNRVLPEGVEKVIDVLSMPAKTLRGGATSLNPVFAASNLVRDQLQTTITGNIGANIKGTPKAFLATFGFGEKADDLRAELSRQGIIGSEYRQTYGYKQGDLMAELQKEHHLSKKATDRLKHPIDALNDLIGRTEYFTRAQQYFGTDGDTTAKSQAARNNTLNFSRGGESIMVINKIVPFLNAGVQGGRQMTAQLVKRPARTALALAAWAGIAMAAKGISESDEKKKELYDRVSDYEKRTNLVLFDKDAKYNPETGRIDGLIKVPIPQFLYPITDLMNNLKDSPDALLKTAGNIFEVFTGLDTENPVNQLTPTAIKPFIEAATNTNTFTKQDIVSDYDKNKLPQDKGAKYTTGAARFLSSLTGVDAPIIDNFIANWSGGLGKDLAKTLTDNPDNQKDGGGIGRILTEGAYRRFGSAGADSQYKMAMDNGEKLKKQFESYSDFKNLSKEEQEKVKNAIDSDFKQIGSTFGKLERGDEVKKNLSDRQTGLLQGFNSNKYIEEVLKGTKQANKERLYNENDYEYNEFKKEYEDKLAKGEYSRKSKIEAQNKLKKLEVGKDFTKETRDLYGLGKNDLRNLIESSDDGDKVLNDVLAYGDALVKAGIISRNKFRDKYGNISLSGSSRSGRSGGVRSGGGTPSYKMDTMSLIRGALQSSSGNKASVSFNRKAAAKANIRAIKRLSGKVKSIKSR